LLGPLKEVEYGWKQLEQIENVAIINKNAFELSDRALVLLAYFKDLGDSLGAAMGKYNDAVRSANSRLIPEIENMKKLGVDIKKPVNEISETITVPENLREFPSLKHDCLHSHIYKLRSRHGGTLFVHTTWAA
jgi:DNA recombination protein RmuC